MKWSAFTSLALVLAALLACDEEEGTSGEGEGIAAVNDPEQAGAAAPTGVTLVEDKGPVGGNDESAEADARAFDQGQAHGVLGAKVMAASLKSSLSSHGVLVTSVTCPDKQPLKVGHSFDCTANCNGTNVRIGVQVKSTQGQYHWAARDHVVNSANFGAEIRKTMSAKGHRVKSVDCHGKTWIAARGASHHCDIKAESGAGYRYVATFTGKGEEHSGKFFQTAWPKPPPIAAAPAPPAPAARPAAAANPNDPASIPAIPNTRSQPPTLSEWRTARQVNMQGRSTWPPGCYMKIVREWLKIHCDGPIRKITHLNNFGRHKSDWFYHYRRNKVADFVVRLRRGRMDLRMWAPSYRATFLSTWHGGDRPRLLALGACYRGRPCWNRP